MEKLDMVNYNRLLRRDIVDFLNSLVYKRFTFDELKNYIKEHNIGFIVELVDKDLEDIDDYMDYNLIGSLQNEKLGILCDFDIYYAKTRKGDMYITEIGYEFE